MFDISFQGGQTTISHSLNNGNQNNIPAMVAFASNNPAMRVGIWILEQVTI